MSPLLATYSAASCADLPKGDPSPSGRSTLAKARGRNASLQPGHRPANATSKAYSAARVGVLEPSANVRPLEEGRCLANGVVRGDGLVFLRQRRAELEELLPEDEPSESAEEAMEAAVQQGKRRQGRRMSEQARLKISEAQKLRWQDPLLRESGRVPWNKGKKLSEETRRRMSAAKRDATIPRAVRLKMKASHVGLTHSPETCALLSERLSGRSKSDEHRVAIAVAQRKRAASARVLQAIEASHRCDATGSASTSGRGKSGPARPAYSTLVGRTCSTGGSGGAGGGDGGAGPGTVVQSYVAQLREFRGLQEELAPWTQAFSAKHGRKPCIADVEATGIAWLVGKYKQYVLLRERVLGESRSLRTKLEASKQEGKKVAYGASPFAGRATGERQNGNSTAANGRGAGERLALAQQYRQHQQQVTADGSIFFDESALASASWPPDPPGDSASLPSAGASASENGAGPGCIKAAISANGRVQTGRSTPDAHHNGARAANSSANDTISSQVSVAKAVRTSSLTKTLPSASPRVRAAMLAAMEYKRKKQQNEAKQ